MRNFLFLGLIAIIFSSCESKEQSVVFKNYDEAAEIEEQQNHKKARMRFKRIQSKYLDKNAMFEPFKDALNSFTDSDYENLKPYILEKDIPTLQEAVKNRILSYEQITMFYLYRIRKFESDSTKMLNGIIALNPAILEEARAKDREPRPENVKYSLFGLPILLKDNINTKGMPTTAGAYALKDNAATANAFIVDRLKENGALILGKVNLSEWAYYFCAGCPLGYSAMGGQTLNPYGRGEFESGGSSSGSGVTIAANYAVAAVGTETAGSITSPSGQNSLVGLKPTIGLLSRTGIVPISSTLDTPGPMTKSVIDNIIFLEAMLGYDKKDRLMNTNYPDVDYFDAMSSATLKGKKLGAFKRFLADSLYANAVDKLKKGGAEIIEIEPDDMPSQDFLHLLNIDMKYDLPDYLANQADSNVSVKNIQDIINLNNQDSVLRAPYGQGIFKGIVSDTVSKEYLEVIKKQLMKDGRAYFDSAMDAHNLDAVLSVNYYHSVSSASAYYPCLAMPMGYTSEGEPVGLTFIAKSNEEKKLYELGYAFEKVFKARKAPENYK